MKKINSITDKIIYGILMAIPLFILVFAFVHVSFHGDYEGINANGMITDIAAIYDNAMSTITATNGSAISTAMTTALQYLWFGENQGSVPTFVNTTAAWWVYVTLMHVLIDILRWIPSVLCAILKKAGVDDEM